MTNLEMRRLALAGLALVPMTGAGGLRDRGRAAAGEASAVTEPGVPPDPERHRRPPDTVVRCRLYQQVAYPPNLAG